MKVAVVDLGTNSCRLLLAEVDTGRVKTRERLAVVTRLGEGVDHRRALNAAAARRTLDCLAAYGRRIERFRPERRQVIATSALRDTVDGERFLDAVERRFALPWRVLGGDEEAALAFAGAASGVAAQARACAAARPVGSAAEAAEAPPFSPSPRPCPSSPSRSRLVMLDIGGGSTELALGPLPCLDSAFDEVPRPDTTSSLDVGSVRLTERFLLSDPPTDEEWRGAERFTRGLLAAAVPREARSAALVVGVAGTITTLVAHKLGLRTYDAELVHGHRLSLRDMERAIAVFRGLTSEQRADLPGIQRGREDVIPAGALIAREACLLLQVDGLIASEADILDGVALELALTA